MSALTGQELEMLNVALYGCESAVGNRDAAIRTAAQKIKTDAEKATAERIARTLEAVAWKEVNIFDRLAYDAAARIAREAVE